jgi:IS605 OrfB family transposase
MYHCSLLADARQEKRDWVIGNLAREIVADLIEQKVGGLVLEELDIKQTHDTNARFNRRTVNFVHRRLHEATVREALRAGLEVKLVNPAYSSVMGRLKYAGPTASPITRQRRTCWPDGGLGCGKGCQSHWSGCCRLW